MEVSENLSEVKVWGSGDVDRISCLPDSVLCHIVSFLPTKDAVATSMLSTQWKRIFSLIPNLKLDFDDVNMSKEKFESFVDKVLLIDLHDVNHVLAMRISCSKEHWSRIKSWISAAVRLNVESLDLKFMIRQPHWFADEISKCSRLTTLKLTNSPIYVPETFRLPNLKLLKLQEMGFVKENTIINLLDGCPVLQELVMVGCRVYAQTLCISVPSLKCLTLQDLMFLVENGVFEVYDFEIVLDTPDLKELYYYDYHVAPRYTAGDLTFLQKARLDIKPDANQEEDDYIGYSVNVAEFVAMCSMAKCLYLSARTLQAVYCSHCQLRLFPNLSHLDLQLNVVCPSIWKLVIYILECASSLISLGIEMGLKKFKECEKCEVDLGEWIPKSVALHLRKISVSSFTGAKQEILLLMFFLKHATYLEKMIIHIDSEIQTEEQLLTKEIVLNLPHSSNDCLVVVKTSAGT